MRFDPLEEAPESLMRWLRPAGLALLALFIGTAAMMIVSPLVTALGGPGPGPWSRILLYVVSALAFVVLLRRSRRKQQAREALRVELEAERAQRASAGLAEPASASHVEVRPTVLVAGVLAAAMGGVALWLLGDRLDGGQSGAAWLMLGAGVTAVIGELRRAGEIG
ncbi:hypothetical protein E5843_01875 [Luteimonas yindakuii]|uniref:hypothetical protein n=1 Tax=Luteimonas yindakuii TaxID=2565782 RepID=UPI0010A3D4B3|nr:hypothetical protein [Luteimonas yindakuii]QCO66851.1 hypothetical protein E5843_01875 [Luteimonas yindakuii]